MIIRIALYLIIIFQLSACNAWNDWRMERSIEKMSSEARAKIDSEACVSSGGKVEGIGIFGIPSCVAYYIDGGKSCTDNSQCQGLCFTPNTHEIGTAILGLCQSSEHDSFGCISTVENGVVSEAFCQD
ncbi:hypothetical protein ACJJIG_02525 [Microbulbifer sp. SSSA007]|uniref:hypothetical protein n=1 Tax=Microbulbifer sp. SSSA007 TaxID=3243379 RepID=UPI0040393E5C